MQIKTMIANVQDTLRRPDLANQIAQRVRGAVLWAHRSEFFIRDRITQTQNVQANEGLIRLSLPPYWRQFEIIRPLDQGGNPIVLSTDTADHVGYREIDPHQVLDFDRSNETNYYYVAGDVINIKTDSNPSMLYFMYYALPDLRSDDAVTWITEQYQEMIEFRALSVMYSIIGNQELRNTYERLALEQQEQLRDNAFQAGAAQ